MPCKNKSKIKVWALAAAIAIGSAHAASPSEFLKPGKGSASNVGTLKSKPVAPNDTDLPSWLRDSERLNTMLGANADMRIENARAIRKVETPIPGLEGFVVEADTYTKENPEPKKDLFVFYTDQSRRYLVVGMMIDMEKERDLNQVVERYVRGEMADNPAKALRPQDMHAIMLAGGKSKSPALSLVIDLGPAEGKSSFLGVVQIHRSLMASGANPRPLRIIPVSAGKDELSTGAMAMALGFEKLNGDGAVRLIEFAEKGKNAPWLDPKRLRKDASLKQAMGTGVFQVDDNSTQAMLARLDTLPLVYDANGDQIKFVPLPTSPAEWRALLLK